MKKTGLLRNTIDKYYTSNSTVKLCIHAIKNNININDDDIIIEPSAGNGAFIDVIKEISKKNIFLDIEPEHVEVIKKDFLTFTPPMHSIIHTIGNPPFGRQSSTVIKFIKHACTFSNTIGFILPKSFKKDSLKKHFDTYFHLIYEIDIPENSFIVDNKSYNVPCIFQIWIKKNTEREQVKKLETEGYEFVKKNDKPDMSFRRVGVNAGKIDENIENKSEQSHYFIKCKNKLNDEKYKMLKNIEWSCKNNTIGPRSISKQELISEFNKIFR